MSEPLTLLPSTTWAAVRDPDPGGLLTTRHTQARYLAAVPVAAGAVALLATVVLAAHPVPARWWLVAGLWLYALGMAVAAGLESRLSRFRFYERQLDVTSGLLHRRRMTLWYDRVAQLTYARSPLSYLANTASLDLTYQAAPGVLRVLRLSAPGTPTEVTELFELLAPRVVHESHRCG